MYKTTLVLIVSLLFALPLQAQELNCTIKVNFESVPTANKDLLINFEFELKDYVNNYKWGSDNLDDKINCALQINIKNVVGENRYAAEVFIGSSRQVFSANKTSAMLRLFDDAWEFTYVKGRPINHNPYTYNDLTSFLDFYAYLIIGYDYDSYIEMSGTQHFQKAADIASLGRSAGGKGWEQAKSGYSRLQLIQEILNTKFSPMRSSWFEYHFTGLDSMAASPVQARTNIARAINGIGELKKSADPRNQIIRTFFDAKYQEIAEIFIGYPDPKIFLDLAQMDPSHQNTYEEYRKKR